MQKTRDQKSHATVPLKVELHEIFPSGLICQAALPAWGPEIGIFAVMTFVQFCNSIGKFIAKNCFKFSLNL